MLTPGRAVVYVFLGAFAAVVTGAALKGVPAGAAGRPAPQREPSIPKELRERIGAWAEVFLKRTPEFTAVETREETRWGRKGPENTSRSVGEYTVRRSADGAPVVESRVPLSQGDAKNTSKERKGERAYSVPSLSSPFALVARLAERNQDRMKFFFAQDTSDVASDYALVGYRQDAGEGLAELDGKAVYPRGQAWVDADNGRIFRIEDEVSFKNARYTTAVEFSNQNELNLWLPREVKIRTFEKGRIEQEITYSYAGYRLLAPAGAAAPATKP